MRRLLFAWSAIVLMCWSAAPARAQTHAWSMAAQMRVQMQWQRQAMMENRALVQTQMRVARQEVMIQKQVVRAQKTHAPKPKSPPRIKKPPTSSRTTAPKKSTSTKQVRTATPSARKGSSKQVLTALGKNASRNRAGVSPSLARNLARTALRGVLPKPSVLNAGRLALPKMPGASSFAASPSAAGGSGTQTTPAMPQDVASGQAQDPPVPEPDKNPARPPPAPPPPGQPPAVADAPFDASLPLMHKAAEAKGDANPAAPPRRTDAAETSFFTDSISAPSESAGKTSTPESGIMRLVSAIAAGKERTQSPMEVAAIQPDLIRQAPPLPVLQPRYPVSPLLAVD